MRNIGIAVFAGCVMVCGCGRRAAGVGVSDSSRELIETVIKATVNFDHPKAGRGKARVENTWADNGRIPEYEIAFVFKGQCSRSDLYPIEHGKVMDRKFVSAMGEDVYAGLNPVNAVVEAKPAGRFFRRYGFDFHPDTFTRSLGRPLSDLLRRYLKTSARAILTAEVDGDIVTIIADYFDKGRGDKEVLKLDSSKGFRLVAWSSEERNSADELHNDSEKGMVNWQSYNGQWYVASARLEKEWNQEVDGSVKRMHAHVSLNVTEFDDKAVVDDKEFTLDGIGVPEGLYVADRITSVDYRYGMDEDARDKE